MIGRKSAHLSYFGVPFYLLPSPVPVTCGLGGLDGQLQGFRNSEVFLLSPPGFASCRVCLALVVWLAPVPLPASGTKQLFSYIVSGSAPCF